MGPKLAGKLGEVGIYRVEDLLFHLPLRYQDRTRVTPIGGAADGADVVIEGEVRVADIAFGRRRSLVVRLQDGTGTISLRFFHFSAAQKNNLQAGTRLRCFGQVRRGASGLEMYHPEYRQIELGETPVEEALTPVYPTPNGNGQNQWRSLCSQAVTRLRHAARQNCCLPATACAMAWRKPCYTCIPHPRMRHRRRCVMANTPRNCGWHWKSWLPTT